MSPPNTAPGEAQPYAALVLSFFSGQAGRPGEPGPLKQFVREALPGLLRSIKALVLDLDTPSRVRVAAFKELCDRGYGRAAPEPKQAPRPHGVLVLPALNER